MVPHPQSRVLLVVAAPAEAKAVLAGFGGSAEVRPWQVAPAGRRFDIVLSGVSKANAAGAAARFGDPVVHSAILSVGVGGSLPDSDLGIGDVVIATSAVFADEGVQTPERFIDCSEMGFPLGDWPGTSIPTNDRVVRWLREDLAPISPHLGGVATVSTCSGTDALASQVRARTGAIAEGMEGAAVGLASTRLGIAFGEVRVISNTTGDRNSQQWDLKRALQGLTRVISLLAASEGFPG